LETRNDLFIELWEKIKHNKVAMMTTVSLNGKLRSRPMYTQQAEFGGELWFFTNDQSGKIDEIRGNENVNLSYSNPEENLFVSVSGTAELLKDKSRIEEFWSPELKAYFPEGINDPFLALIKVKVVNAEYWDSPAGKMTGIMEKAIAILKGEKVEPGENKKIILE
jgi:general stress protein 26